MNPKLERALWKARQFLEGEGRPATVTLTLRSDGSLLFEGSRPGWQESEQITVDWKGE